MEAYFHHKKKSKLDVWELVLSDVFLKPEERITRCESVQTMQVLRLAHWLYSAEPAIATWLIEINRDACLLQFDRPGADVKV